METFLIKAAQLVLALVILVTVHEFGHYIFARIFGMRVDRFYLFFNPWFSLAKYDPRKQTLQLIAWTKKVKHTDADGKETTAEEPRSLLTLKVGKPHPAKPGAKPSWRDTIYGLGWLPLGGYCSIAGMVDETTDAKTLADEPEPWEFRAKKPMPRLLVMIAGVLFNFLLAIAIYIGIALHWGDHVVPFEAIDEGFDFSPAMHQAGFRDGDKIIALDGKPIDATDGSAVWDMLQPGANVTIVRNHRDTSVVTIPGSLLEKAAAQGKTSPFVPRVPVQIAQVVKGEGAHQAGILEGDRIIKVGSDTTPSFTEFVPALKKHSDKDVTLIVLRNGTAKELKTHINGDGKIGVGIAPIGAVYDTKHVTYSLLESVPKGISDGTTRLTTYVSSLKLLFTKTGAESIGGFGAIGDMYPDKWDWYSFWQITAFLSVILAFMNILPIPALDGGHVVFTLWEIITRRKPSMKVLEYSQMAGMAFLFLLLIYANANDIYRFFLK